jgi:SAM-dependent methyltransferase
MSRSIDGELVALLHCMQCRSERLSIEGDALRCEACGHRRTIDEDNILREASMEAFDPGSVYERATKTRYQSREYALQYMEAYTDPRRLSDLYAVFVAWRERRLVERALRSVASDVALVLDLPAGTGKLAPIHEKFGYRVIAADASAEMLGTGLGVWKKDRQLAGMVQTDVRQTGFRSGSIDCTVCLRLMHRLPADIADEALRELARITRRFLIVSTAIRSRSISSLARRIRKTRKSPGAHGVSPVGLTDWHRRLAAIGKLESTWFLARGVSKGVVSIVDVSRSATDASRRESATAPVPHQVYS